MKKRLTGTLLLLLIIICIHFRKVEKLKRGKKKIRESVESCNREGERRKDSKKDDEGTGEREKERERKKKNRRSGRGGYRTKVKDRATFRFFSFSLQSSPKKLCSSFRIFPFLSSPIYLFVGFEKCVSSKKVNE